MSGYSEIKQTTCEAIDLDNVQADMPEKNSHK